VTTIQGNNTGWTVASTLNVNAGLTRANGIAGNTSGVTSAALGTANIAFGGGLLELRDDSTATFNNKVSNLTVNSTLFIDHTVGVLLRDRRSRLARWRSIRPPSIWTSWRPRLQSEHRRRLRQRRGHSPRNQ